MVHIPTATPETGSGFCSSPSAKACPFSCRAKRVFPSGETLILPVSRDSRYNTLHFASKAVCQREASLGTPVLSGSRYNLHKSAAIPHPSKTQAGGIGQSVPGADLCRLLAYMGAYCIAHINRSNLSLPYAPFLRFGNREIHTEFRRIPQFLFAAKFRSEDTRRLRGAVLRRI